MNARSLSILTAVVALSLSGEARADDPPKPVAPVAPATPTPPAEPAARHENKVTPEATAAFEKFEKLANCPARQGLREATGTISCEAMGMPLSMKFSFAAPSAVHVEPDANAQGPVAMYGRQLAGGVERALRKALVGIRPADDEEFDAELVRKDGQDVLAVTTFEDGAEQGRDDYVLDANGLPSASSSRMQVEMRGQKMEMKSDNSFTWEKSGDTYRLAKLGVTRTGGRMAGTTAISFTYTDVEKFALPTSWKTDVTGAMSLTIESRMSDLTVNGKKVELKAPEVVKPPQVKDSDGDDQGDEGEEEDEGEDGKPK